MDQRGVLRAPLPRALGAGSGLLPGLHAGTPAVPQSRVFQILTERVVEVLVAERAVGAYDICAYNNDVIGFAANIERLLHRNADVTVVPIDVQTYYSATFRGPRVRAQSRARRGTVVQLLGAEVRRDGAHGAGRGRRRLHPRDRRDRAPARRGPSRPRAAASRRSSDPPAPSRRRPDGRDDAGHGRPHDVPHMQADDDIRHIPVILVTAKVQVGERQVWDGLAISGVISKPFDPMTLAEQVGQMLGWDA